MVARFQCLCGRIHSASCVTFVEPDSRNANMVRYVGMRHSINRFGQTLQGIADGAPPSFVWFSRAGDKAQMFRYAFWPGWLWEFMFGPIRAINPLGVKQRVLRMRGRRPHLIGPFRDDAEVGAKTHDEYALTTLWHSPVRAFQLAKADLVC